MRISDFAAMTGESVRTIRFYESIGLLAEPPRTAGRYRNYDVEAIEDVKTVRRLQASGLTLDEIDAILTLGREPQRRAELLSLISDKLADIDARLIACKKLKAELQAMARSSGRPGQAQSPNTVHAEKA